MKKPIKSVFISPCGKYIACIIENVVGDKENDILIFFRENGEKIYEKEYIGWLDDVSVSENKRRTTIATKNEIIVLDKNFDEEFRLELEPRVLHFTYVSRDGRFISAGTYNPGKIRFFEERNILWDFKTKGRITSFFMTDDAERIATADEEGYAYVFNKNGDILLRKKIEHKGLYRISLFRGGVAYTVFGEVYSLFIADKEGNVYKKVSFEKMPISLYCSKEHIFIGLEDELHIFSTNGDLIKKIRFESRINDICSTKDGENLIVGTDGGNLFFIK